MTLEACTKDFLELRWLKGSTGHYSDGLQHFPRLIDKPSSNIFSSSACHFSLHCLFGAVLTTHQTWCTLYTWAWDCSEEIIGPEYSPLWPMITPSITTKIAVSYMTQGRNSDGPSSLVMTVRGSTILPTSCKRLGNIFVGYCISYSSWQIKPDSWIATASILPLRPYDLACRTHSYSSTSTPPSTQQLSTIPFFSRLASSCLRSFMSDDIIYVIPIKIARIAAELGNQFLPSSAEA